MVREDWQAAVHGVTRDRPDLATTPPLPPTIQRKCAAFMCNCMGGKNNPARVLAGTSPVFWASLVAQMVKNLPEMWETWVASLFGKILWKRAWQLTPVLLLRESPWTEELDGLQSMGSQRVKHE